MNNMNNNEYKDNRDSRDNDSFLDVLKKVTKYVFTSVDILVALILIGFSVVYILRWPLNSGSYLPLCLGVAIILLHILKHKQDKSKPLKVMYKIMQIGFLYFLATFTLFCMSTFRSTEIDESKDYDAIVVLGCGLRNGKEMSGTLQYRLDKAIELYELKQVPIVVSGGQGFDELVTEASVMKAYLVENGVPESDVYEEDKSTSTEENFAFSKVILDELFTDDYSIVFTTNDFHVYRSSKYMEKSGLKGFGVGTESIASLIPYNYLREYMAIHLYFLLN